MITCNPRPRIHFLLAVALSLIMNPLMPSEPEIRNTDKEFFKSLVDQWGKAKQRQWREKTYTDAISWFLSTNAITNTDPTDAEVDAYFSRLGPNDMAYDAGKEGARKFMRQERLHAAIFQKYGGIQYPEQGFMAPYDGILMLMIDYLLHHPDQKVDAQDLRDLLVCYQLDAYGLISKETRAKALLPH